MLEALMRIFFTEVPIPTPEAEPLLHGLWELVQQVAAFVLTLLTIWAVGGRKAWKRWEARREAERKTRDRARQAEIKKQVGEIVAPLRQQIDAIHRTTHVNGGTSDPPTLRDEISEVGAKVDSAIQTIGAIAVNQAALSARFDDHERRGDRFLREARAVFTEHGINLPDT